MNRFIANNFIVKNTKQWIGEVNHWRIIIPAILLIGFDYVFFIKPNFQQYNWLQNQEINLKLEFEKKQQNVATLQVRHKELKRLNKEYKGWFKQFSTPQGIAIVLEEISKAGTANGLIFEFFAPLPEVAMDFYIELPIKMTIRGHYEQLTLFFKQIAQWNKIVTIDNFELLPVFDEKQKVKTELLVMKIIAKVYRPL